MKGALLSAACLVLIACDSTGSHTQNPSPTATGPESPTASSTLQPPGTVVADLPVSTSPVSCRLPVITQTSLTTKVGGFVTFPAATYQQDPAGGLTAIGDGEVATQAAPVLVAYGESPFYDLAMRRFIPASPSQTAPDGRTYVYVSNVLGGGNPTVFVVSVATGDKRGIPFPINRVVHADDFDGRYVYLVGGGVWRMDTSTGQVQQWSVDENAILVHDGTLWVGSNNPADTSPPPASPGRIDLPQGGRVFDTISQVVYPPGNLTTWIYAQGIQVFLLGFDSASHPVLALARQPDFNARFNEVAVLDTPGGPVNAIFYGGFLLNHVQANPDGRIWFGSDHGIYLWTPNGGGFQRVFASDLPIAPGGFCV